MRGEVKDEKGNFLPNVRMILHSNGYLYYGGSSGGFGLQSSRSKDTITVSFEGFQEQMVPVESSRYEYIVLKMQSRAANLHKNHLVSVTKDMRWQERHNWATAGETYSNLLENEFIPAKKFPETG